MKPFQVRSSERGVALVIVLSFLVLITVMVVAFFSSVSAERTVSQSYAEAANVKVLAETTIELVTSQIREATAPLPLISGANSQLSWASQPGMIRVFGDPNSAGPTPYAYYKLYSSDKMVVTKNFISGFKPEDEVAAFTTPSGLFTDLNQPVLVRDDIGGTITIDDRKYRADYPIFDPTAVGVVEGFHLGKSDNAPGLVNPPGYNGNYPVSPSDGNVMRNNPAPMPVRWIYVLKDGTLTTPISSENGICTFSTKAPTKQNPIVGRIAFWTDDETAKVNINTASEATFWDTPFTSSKADAVNQYTAGGYQPMQDEYQRYPGHPFTTCLSPIFGKAFGLNRTFYSPAPLDPADPTYLAFKDLVYAMAPRVAQGGSNSGARVVRDAQDFPVTTDSDRLYPSVEELFFKPNLSGGPSGGFATRELTPKLTPALLQQTKFFLTANSRAPELNLFGRPRVSIWPVNAQENARSAKDRVFAFTSTIGKSTSLIGLGQYPFFFARSDSKSPTADYEDAGRGGRNKKLYDYLWRLTGQSIPGFGGKFESKFGSDREQILTEIFDYIRCTNLSEQSGTGGTPFTPPYEYLEENSGDRAKDFAGQVTPIEIGYNGSKTRGFGRFPTISEVVLLFTKEVPAQTDKRMRAVLMFEVFCPSLGYMGLKDTYRMKVDARNLKIEDPMDPSKTILLFPQEATNAVFMGTSDDTSNTGRSFGGYMGVRTPLKMGAGVQKTFDRTATAGALEKYPFISDFIKIPSSGNGPIKLKGGSIQVQLIPGIEGNPTTASQTVTVEFPAETQMNLPTNGSDFTASTAIGTTGGNWLTGTVIRSMEAKTDLRLIAARKEVSSAAGYFGPTGTPSRWANPATAQIHSMRTSVGGRIGGAVPTGTLVTVRRLDKPYPDYRWDSGNSWGVPAQDARMADLPEGVNGVVRLDGGPGDWDTGFSKWYDGPFINKPDEGKLVLERDRDTMPYFQGNDGGYSGVNAAFYAPNRLLASAGWFGSLPTGVMRNRPYETLLFRPDYTNHPGLATSTLPPDHLLMDMFTMPVVEPYPISEPFSTAGKINMNYQIMPFGSYLKRDTAMRAVLRGEKMVVIPLKAKRAGHTELGLGSLADSASKAGNTDYSYQIDEDTTLAFLERRWRDDKPERQIFRSATEICELDLYPKGYPRQNDLPELPPALPTKGDALSKSDFSSRWRQFWTEENPLTGDNVRERPYARLYARLTTKSNTYTVHMRVQSLQFKPPTDAEYATWNENTGRILGEYRGSALIERYLDPADRRFEPNSSLPPSERLDPDNSSLEKGYRFRVLSTKQFVP